MKELYKRNRCLLLPFVALIALCITNYHYKLLAVNTSTTVDSENTSFSILTFNIAAYDTIKFTTSLQTELVTLIHQEQPDIVCFQEMSYEDILMIRPKLDNIYTSSNNLFCNLPFYSHLPQRNIQRYKCVGDVPVGDLNETEKKEVIQMQKQMHVSSSEFEVEPGHWITIFSGQLRSSAYSTARRSMDKDANWFEGLPLYWRNYKIGKRIRDYETQNVRRFVDEARAEGKPVIVAGDLNDWCGSDCLNTLMGDDLKDAWWEGGNGFGWTYFGWHLRLRLDHILYSNELELVDVKVIDSNMSDHKPLMARFRFK